MELESRFRLSRAGRLLRPTGPGHFADQYSFSTGSLFRCEECGPALPTLGVVFLLFLIGWTVSNRPHANAADFFLFFFLFFWVFCFFLFVFGPRWPPVQE